MNIFDIIYIPFGFIIRAIYSIFGNYMLTLLCFAIVVKLAMLPLTIKQQKGQIRMAQLRPKEQAIRKKYAGRNDTATQQKMQTELMEMYKSENYSPMSSCLPLSLSVLIIFPLYQIIREPLRYIAQFSSELILQIKSVAFTLFGEAPEYADIFRNVTESTVKNISEINIVKIMDNPANLAAIMRDVPDIPEGFKNINMMLYGNVSLADSPAMLGISLLLFIPVLNFLVQFFSMRITRKINAGTAAGEMADNKGMKMMEYTMPLLTVYMAYTLNAALGLYWIFQGVIQLVQTIILSKVYPIPKMGDEAYKLAEKEYGVKNKPQKKPRRPYQDDDEDELTDEDLGDTREGDAISDISDEDNDEDGKDNKDSKDEKKYVSDSIPKGINPAIKNNYQKTGSKYSVKKKKK